MKPAKASPSGRFAGFGAPGTSPSLDGSSQNNLNFAIVLHAHQPMANSDETIENVLKSSYFPVLKKLQELPWLRFSLHLSGSLLERLEKLSPNFMQLLRDLLNSGKVEFLGGGYHEPLMPFIPSRDRREQVIGLRKKLGKSLGATARGAWIAERMWEPSLPGDLSDADVEYTLVDEHGFIQAGFDESQLSRPFLTEDQGKSLVLFPISKSLRYLIPFADVGQVEKVLRDRAEKHSGSLWTFADDLEKFGSWPGTWDLVHSRGWLDGFLEMLANNQDWLKTMSLSDARDRIPVSGPAYIPSVSYPEMMRWSLPPHVRSDATRNGNPRNFLSRYPEVNLLHKRMLMASEAVHTDAKISRPAQDFLWQSQTSNSYWYGWFGGAYLPSLRLHARASASKAETLAFRKMKKDMNYQMKFDIDLCGVQEAVVSTSHQWLLFKARRGNLLAWEDRGSGFDRFACMVCHPEEGGKPPSRFCSMLPFEDLFLPIGVSLEHLLEHPDLPPCNPWTSGDSSIDRPVLSDWKENPDGAFSLDVSRNQEGFRVELENVFAFSGDQLFFPIQVIKRFSIPFSSVGIFLDLKLKNPGLKVIEFAYALRIPFSVSLKTPQNWNRISFPEIGLLNIEGSGHGEVSGIQDIRINENHDEQTYIFCNRPLTVWYHPMVIHLPIEGRISPVIQGSVIFLVMNFQLDPGEEINLQIRLTKELNLLEIAERANG